MNQINHSIPSNRLSAPSRRLSVAVWQTWGYFVAFIALGLVSASLGPTLTALAQQTRSTLAAASFLFTGRSFGYLLGSLQGGRLYDRMSGHPLMAGVLLTIALIMFAVPLVPALWLLAAMLLLLGAAEGALDVGGNALLCWVHGARVGPYMNGLHFFFGVGAFLSPIIISQLTLLSGDIIWPYWTLALLILPVAAWLWRVPSPLPAAAAPGDAPGVRAPATRLSGSAARLLLVLIAAFFFLYTGAETGFGGWVFTYTVRLGLGSETTAAYLNSLFWGSLTLGRLLSIPLAAHVAPRAMLWGDLVGCLVGIGLIVFWPTSSLLLWVGTFVFGFSMASIFPTVLSFAERRLAITGRVTGWFFVGASAGSMALPRIIGQLFEAIGPRVTMHTIMVDIIAATAVWALLTFFATRAAKAATTDR